MFLSSTLTCRHFSLSYICVVKVTSCLVHFISLVISLFIYNSTLDYIFVHKMICSCEVTSLGLSVYYVSQGCLTIYVYHIYSLIKMGWLGGEGGISWLGC